MTIYGEPSPRLVELFDRVGVNFTWFTLLQAHGGDIRIS
jgi:hypothetical protein